MQALLQTWAFGGWDLDELTSQLSECLVHEVWGIDGLIGWVGLGRYVLNVE